MGKSSNENPQSVQELNRIAGELYGYTDPLRQNLIGSSMQFLGMDPSAAMSQQPTIISGTPAEQNPYQPGSNQWRDWAPSTNPMQQQTVMQDQPMFNPDYLPGPAQGVEASPLFAALKQTTEDQYGVARDNILASTPAGGGLGSNLADLEMARAKDMTGNIARLYQDELNRAMSLATGAPLQSSLGALGTAGGIQSNIAAQNSAQNAATKQALGTGAGLYFGGKA